jgi:hypothetical protein
MIHPYEYDSLKVLFMGIFFGWLMCKYMGSPFFFSKKIKTISNFKFKDCSYTEKLEFDFEEIDSRKYKGP